MILRRNHLRFESSPNLKQPTQISKEKSNEKSNTQHFRRRGCGAACCVRGGGGGSTTAPPTLTTSTELAADAVKAFLAKQDASLATAIPTTGAAAAALTDACSLNNGFSKALGIADYDADPLRVASRQFDIGSTRTSITVLADRPSTNADGTTRRELDVEYVINYADGTKLEKATQTLISGSSSGSTMADKSVCAVAENKTDWRFFGNRKVVNTFVTATNERKSRAALATGLPLAQEVVYSKYITLGVSDPAGVATYAIITGPGISTVTTGQPGSLKQVSPRLLRSAAEFAGKRGNFVDWKDTDTFRSCSNVAGTGSASAETANCAVDGSTGGNLWGTFDNASGSAMDAFFTTLNINAGAVYTIAIYGDDGWKTVNGQAGKTPIATYTSTLENAPYSAAALAGAAPGTDLFPKLLTTGGVTSAQAAAAITGKSALSVNATWSAPATMPDSRALALTSHNYFEQGRASAGPAFNPASRQSYANFSGSMATAGTFAKPVPVPELITPTYGQFDLNYTNRNGNGLRSLYTFQ